MMRISERIKPAVRHRLRRAGALFLGLLWTGTATAAPHFGDYYELQQPDGSTVEVRIFGDEFYQRVETPDGYTLVRNSDGWITYAQLDASGEQLIPTAQIYYGSGVAGISALSTEIQQKSLDASARVRAQIRAQNQQKLYAGAAASGASVMALSPPINQSSRARTMVGDVQGLTILIDFSDEPAVVPHAEIEGFFNESGYTGNNNNGSVYDYFFDVSDGKLRYSNTVTAYYRAQNPKSYYDSLEGGRTAELITEALDYLAASGFDFSTISVDANNRIHGLNIFYAGEPSWGWSNGLWPHSGYLNYSVGGVSTRRYQVTNISNALTLAVTLHENGHMLMDWPDLYDYGGESSGIGVYGLMAGYASTTNPLPPNPYFRALAGWQEPIELEAVPGVQTLTMPSNDLVSYRFVNPDNASEFFIFESILQVSGSRYAHAPDQGALLWHIDENGSNGNEQMLPNLRYMVSVEQADGRFDLENGFGSGDSGDLFDASLNQVFGTNTVPNSRWWSGASARFQLSNFSSPGVAMTVDFEYGAEEDVGVRYEAEDQVLHQAVVEMDHAGFYGTGYVNTDNVAGSFIMFELFAPYAGNFPMTLRYANGSSAARPVDISYYGAHLLTLELPPTGAWTNWQEVGFELPLEEGRNLMHFTSAGSVGAPNIDAVTQFGGMVEVNLPPVVVNPIADIVIPYGADSFVIDLNSVFSDPEGVQLNYSRESTNDESPNLMFDSATTLRVFAEEEGTETHYIIASDDQNQSVSTSFDLTVLPPAEFSLVLQAEEANWANGVVESDHSGYTGSGYLNTVNAVDTWVDFEFNVPADGQYEVRIRYANGASARGQQVRVNGQLQPVDLAFAATGGWTTWLDEVLLLNLSAGYNDIRLISLTSGGAANLDSLSVSLVGGEDNQAPVVIGAISDATLNVGQTLANSLSVVFDDPDGDVLSFTAASSNPSGASASVGDGIVWAEALAPGAATITVTASDGLQSVSTSFVVTVSDNQPPYASNPLQDMTLEQGSASFLVDLATLFADPDGDPMTYDREASDDESLNLMFEGPQFIRINPLELGTVRHYLIANDNRGGTGSFSFELTVVPADTNRAPVVANPIEDIVLTQGDPSYQIDLNTVFSDPDGDTLYFDRDATDNDSPNLRFVGTGLIEISAEEVGTETHYLRAFDDGEAEVILEFDLTVLPAQVNRAPIVVNPIEDIVLTLGDASYQIDLNTVFSDPDGDTLYFDRDATDNDSPNLRFVGTGVIEISAEEVGTETHYLRAFDDDEAEVILEFDLTVEPAVVDNPPVVIAPIEDITLTYGDGLVLIDLYTVFADPEGQALRFDHYPQDEELDDVQLLPGGVLEVNANTAGTNVHTVFAIDDSGGDAWVEFTVTVLPPESHTAFYEAEEQQWDNATVDANHSGFTGNGFVNTENVAGTGMRLDLTVPVAGRYRLDVRYANGSTARGAQFYVNGDPAGTADFSGTGAWATWVTESITLDLAAGDNQLGIQALTSGGLANIDNFTVELLD